jgi:ketosteroid isomerase-like protein
VSERNTEIVRRGYDHFAATGEMAADQTAPEFIWDMSKFGGWPEQQLYEGLEGAQEFMRVWLEAWDDWVVELISLHDAGDEVVAVVRQHGRSKTTGLPVDMKFGQVWTVKDGMQTRMVMYADPAEALQAAGLSQ